MPDNEHQNHLYFMGAYDHLPKDELIRLLEARDRYAAVSFERIPNKEGRIKQIISDVLMLLFSSEKKESIDRALHLLMKYFDTDWVYVATFDPDRKVAQFLYEVTSPWVHTTKEDASELSSDTIPWMIDTILRGEDIVLADIDRLPPQASVDRALLEEQGLLSMLVIPITYEGEVQGLIGFDSMRVRRQWTHDEVENLHIIANIFSVIVERVRTQRNIQQSRTRLIESDIKFKMIFENLPVGVELYDERANLLDLNEADTAIFGTAKDKRVGRNLLADPDVPDEIKEGVSRGRDFSCRWIYAGCADKTAPEMPDRTHEPKYLQVKAVSLFDQEVGRIGFLLIIADNTEAHLKAEQTEDNLATLKAVLLSGHSIVGEYDTTRREFFVDPVLNANLDDNEFFALFKQRPTLPLEELKSLMHPDTLRADYGVFEQVARGERSSCSAVVRIRMNGKEIWLRINMQAHKKRDDGTPGNLVVYMTNITEEKELEVKLREAEEENRLAEIEKQKAQEADKLKSAFLANMSHEIRTPLNAIVGFSSLVAEAENAEEQQRYLSIINKNNELLVGLITDILDFSKIESGKLDYTMSRVDLKEICSELYLTHAWKTQPGVEMIFRKDELPAIRLRTDAKRLTQVISNLLTNAVKFTDSGSITLSYRLQGDEVCVEVADTGIGIAPEYCDRIFHRFVKVDEFQQGTGLGLPICKTIVETLNGRIGVRSKPGHGSVFWFTLPLGSEDVPGVSTAGETGSKVQGGETVLPGVGPVSDEAAAESGQSVSVSDGAVPAAGQENIVPSPAVSGATGSPVSRPALSVGEPENEAVREGRPAPVILIAEDVEENYRLLEVLLGKKYKLLHARNGREAVDFYRKYRPDLVLMDIRMPVMDGFEASCEIRRYSDVPIVALSAFAFESEKQRARECGIDDYLVKPLDIPALKVVLSRYFPESC